MSQIQPILYTDIFKKCRTLMGPAFTISLAFLAQSLIISTDVMMLGWLGVEQLAASGFVARLFLLGFLLVIGFCITVTSLVGQALGGKDRITARRMAQQIFWVACAVSMVSAYVMSLLLPLYLSVIEQPLSIQQYALDYGYWIWLSLPFAGLVSFHRLYMTVFKRTAPFVILGFILVVINAILDFVLIFGFWFIPALGISGASLATFIVSVLHVGGLMWCMYTLKPYKKEKFFKGLLSPKIFSTPHRQVKKIFATGVPISLRMMGESLLAGVYYIIVATQGTNFAAAYQAATQMETMVSLFTIGIAITIATEVGGAKGAKNMQSMILSIISGTILLMCIMVPVSFALFIFSQPIAIVFLPDDDPTTLATRSILVKMFGLVALFHTVRLLQVIISATFDGLGDTKRPAAMLLATMWCVGGIGGYILSLTSLSAYGVMIAHTCAVIIGVVWIGLHLYHQLCTYEQQFLHTES